ncbi:MULTISPECIES: YbaB/EbfC family nucleoid-associated protein [Anaerococcus]|mgnify:FL=1|uniref:Nucleoid-associated protein AVLFYP127_00899 n=2 Tax=Anaerococcus TaxID=165779 RepID=A0A6N2TZA9_9FIRM|nr:MULTISPECIES: YbaB/EbfC family nucleoid-associated protein [Anaerococcus]MBS4888631.1 YbaB/EbfC family nucleoid-associated protein [Anaerococcus vaginalis]MBS6920494.1 YbaB/EbfC family nucleoid-associated protein [Anaerococcus vaginalis]MDD7766066.1 YbaB/EbfC family nucleoid-associated protein [Anaerococcus vaginalis]MDU1031083.1 YbaB/EbfC family nucleoid-associated protein [Anaerococcus vaginalis]MDU1708408.1 YbaB/EbfC family nucleoid-associated protein [Anaerococcus vaginalis]
MARGGFPGGGNMNSMMKKVQKMQQEMARTQQEIEEKEFSSTAGGGVIEAVVNGKKEVVKIKIDEDVVDPEDTEMLEDLVVAAINDALKKADEYSQKEMGKLTGNINIPGLM